MQLPEVYTDQTEPFDGVECVVWETFPEHELFRLTHSECDSRVIEYAEKAKTQTNNRHEFERTSRRARSFAFGTRDHRTAIAAWSCFARAGDAYRDGNQHELHGHLDSAIAIVKMPGFDDPEKIYTLIQDCVSKYDYIKHLTNVVARGNPLAELGILGVYYFLQHSGREPTVMANPKPKIGFAVDALLDEGRHDLAERLKEVSARAFPRFCYTQDLARMRNAQNSPDPARSVANLIGDCESELQEIAAWSLRRANTRATPTPTSTVSGTASDWRPVREIEEMTQGLITRRMLDTWAGKDATRKRKGGSSRNSPVQFNLDAIRKDEDWRKLF